MMQRFFSNPNKTFKNALESSYCYNTDEMILLENICKLSSIYLSSWSMNRMQDCSIKIFSITLIRKYKIH